ncbi:MAG: hypothetical protein C1O27_002488 [Chloroflexi bacterium]|jgi:hypothetical protein|nr:MAG: hypothetical protein C1O27_002488 [Chloroflexota bacterium]
MAVGVQGDSDAAMPQALLDHLEELAAQKSVDGKRLAAKVKSWTPGQTMAVLDAKERYWFSLVGGMNLEREFE